MFGEDQESCCTDCGNFQYTDHLGSQKCKKCGLSSWLDVYSFKKCIETNKNTRQEIGLQ